MTTPDRTVDLQHVRAMLERHNGKLVSPEELRPFYTQIESFDWKGNTVLPWSHFEPFATVNSSLLKPGEADSFHAMALALMHSHVVVTDSRDAPGFIVSTLAALADFANVLRFAPPFHYFYGADVDKSGRITHHIRDFGELRLGTVFFATGGH